MLECLLKIQNFFIDDPFGFLDKNGIDIILKINRIFKKVKKTIVLFSDNKDIINLSHQNIAISN